MSDTQINAAVALLRARDDTIAALNETIANQTVTIRWLKTLVDEADREAARAQQLANESFFDGM